MEYHGFHLPDWKNFNASHFDNVELPIIEEIVSHFNDGIDLVIGDIPTGIGKTVIGECVRQSLGGVPGIYMCTSLQLQSQFMNDFLWGNKIMGRSNYKPNGVREYTGNWSIDPTCADCDLDYRTECCTFCASPPECPYKVAKSDAIRSDLVCMNTAYFLGECNMPKTQFSGRELVIADEADTLEDQMMNFVSVDVSARMRDFLGLDAPEHKTREAAEKHGSWKAWVDYAEAQIARRLRYMDENSLMNKRRKQAVVRLLESLTHVRENIDEYVYTGYEKDDSRGAIQFKPVTVSHVGEDVLWRHGKKWLAMSATIISPEQRVKDWGYRGSWAPVFAESVYDPERRPIYFVPEARMINKMEAEEFPKMVPALKAVLDHYPDDRVLVHTHSKKLTTFLRDGLEGIERPVFWYLNKDQRDMAIEEYEATERAVLLAMSLDRGYDGKDDLCRVVVVAKVPAPYLGDKQINARLHTSDGEMWYALKTCESLVQMAGRGMRHEEDFADTIILDAQFGSFMEKWSIRNPHSQRKHRLLPNWYMEAFKSESKVRFEIHKKVKQFK